MIAFGRAGWATTESIPQLAGALRLDQISALYELIGDAAIAAGLGALVGTFIRLHCFGG